MTLLQQPLIARMATHGKRARSPSRRRGSSARAMIRRRQLEQTDVATDLCAPAAFAGDRHAARAAMVVHYWGRATLEPIADANGLRGDHRARRRWREGGLADWRSESVDGAVVIVRFNAGAFGVMGLAPVVAAGGTQHQGGSKLWQK